MRYAGSLKNRPWIFNERKKGKENPVLKIVFRKEIAFRYAQRSLFHDSFAFCQSDKINLLLNC